MPSDVGLALSESDASIVAPFASARAPEKQSIGAMVALVQHGRCAVASCVAIYCFLTAAGFGDAFNKGVNYAYDGYPSKGMYFFKDMVSTPFLATAIALTAPPADAARAIGASAWAGGVRKAKEMNKLLPALAPRTPS